MGWLVVFMLLFGLAGAGEVSAIDINHASQTELVRVPGLGPAKARAIVRYRLKHGPYRRVAHLERVSGLSTATVGKLKPYLVVGDYKEAKQAVREQRESAPPYAGPFVNVNEADVAELTTLPGVGPTKAQAIFDNREKRGRFRSCRSLERVTGIGPSTVEQLAEACITEPREEAD